MQTIAPNHMWYYLILNINSAYLAKGLTIVIQGNISLIVALIILVLKRMEVDVWEKTREKTKLLLII